ncbi:MAG: OmpA family protein [Myxococcales bacterium]
MSRSQFAIAAVFTVAASSACSHEQKTEIKPPLAAVSPTPARPTARRAVAQPIANLADAVPKRKDGDAIYFDFDSVLVKEDARHVLREVADTLHRKNASLEIDGNCDELGTVEYNLALGEHRARAAKEYLVELGVSPSRIATLSLGSQRPKFPGHDDEAHAKNRRDDFLLR